MLSIEPSDANVTDAVAPEPSPSIVAVAVVYCPPASVTTISVIGLLPSLEWKNLFAHTALLPPKLLVPPPTA